MNSTTKRTPKAKKAKNHTAARQAIRVPLVGGYEHTYDRAGRDFWQEVQRCGLVADYLLTHGLFAIPDPTVLFSIIEAVGNETQDLKRSVRTIEALVKTVKSGPLEETQLEALRRLDDHTYAHGNEWAEAGYLLGIAVGMRINAAAFNGGGQ
jgi:hypothetical protein